MLHFLAKLRDRKRACALAEKACLVTRPQEPIYASQIYADRPDRFIVRVFCGRRSASVYLMPPWKECLVFAVVKGSNAVEELTDERYHPRLR